MTGPARPGSPGCLSIEYIYPVGTDETTDEILMTQLCRGDKSALAELVRRYENDVFRFSVHYLRDVERARDVAQETFIRVFVARDRFDATRRFRPWILCIARNLCLNELKRRKVAAAESLDAYTELAGDAANTLASRAEDGPDARVMAAERNSMLEAALDTLGDEAREIIVLRFFQRMSASEIAHTIGSTEGAVRTRIHRILKRLKKRLEEVADA